MNNLFSFYLLAFYNFFLVEFCDSDIACLDSKDVLVLYDYTMGSSSHYQIPSADS